MAEPTQPGNDQPPFTIGGNESPWALEDTLKKVLTTLQKDLTLTTRESKTIDNLNRNVDRLINVIDRGQTNTSDANKRGKSSAEDSRRALQEIQRTSKQAAASQEELTRATKQSKADARQALLGGGMGGRGGGSAVLNMAKAGVQRVWTSISNAGRAILESGGDIQAATQGVAASLPILGGLMGAAVGMVHQTQEHMNNIAKFGQTFDGSMRQFSQTAWQSAVSMTQASAILTENSETVAKMGSEEFLQLQFGVRRATEQFGRFGLSIEDQAKTISNFYEMQMASGRRQNATNVRSITEYTAKLSTLSRLTGKSIDQIMEEQRSTVESGDRFIASERVFQRYGESGATAFEDMFDSTANLPTELQGMAQEVLSSLGNYESVANTKLGAVIAAAGKQGEAVEAYRTAMETGNAEEFNKFLGQFFKDIGQRGSTERGVLTALGQGSDDVASAAREIANATAIANRTNQDVFGNVAGQVAKTMEDTRGGDMAAITQQQTETQMALGQAQTELLSSSLELYPSLSRLAEVAAQATVDLLQTKTARAAIDEFTEALSKAPAGIENLLDTMSDFHQLDDAVGTAITKIMDLGSWLGNTIGIGEGWGQALLLGGGMLLTQIGIMKGAFSGGKWLTKGAGSMLGAGKAGGAGIAGAGALGLAAKAAGGIGGAYTVYQGAKQASSSTETSDKVIGHGSAALGGAATGALIGSVVPILGTAIGALAGAAIGAGGSMLYDYLDDSEYKSKPLETPTVDTKKPTEDQAAFQRTRMEGQSSHFATVKNHNNVEMQQMQSLFNLRVKMEQIYNNLQIKLATIRHEHERTLIERQHGVMAANTRQTGRTSAALFETSFREQVQQSKNISNSIEQFKDKSAKMGTLGQSGIIVQPSIGEDIGGKQLQEMRLTNQFLYNIYDNQRGANKFKPLISMYQSGL